jgi:hypothetical protein
MGDVCSVDGYISVIQALHSLFRNAAGPELKVPALAAALQGNAAILS